MRTLSLSVIAVSLLTCTLQGQTTKPPIPPCGLQGEPDNTPCIDLKTGKLYHTGSLHLVPTIPKSPAPPVDTKPITIPKMQPPPPPHVAPVVRPSWGKPEQRQSGSQQSVDVTAQQPAPSIDPPEIQREQFENGYAFGSALGEAIYEAHVRHAINKACFDKGAHSLQLEDGQTIKCSNWEILHPRHERGVPSDLTADFAATLHQICQQEKSFIYLTRIYSCKDWKKYENGVAAGSKGIKTRKVNDNASENLFLEVMETDRLNLILRQADAKEITSWSWAKDQYCSEHPDAFYRKIGGNIGYCGGMARQAYLMMEKLRKDITNLRSVNDGLTKMVVEESTSSWHDMKNIYCQDVPNGRYTDLDEKEQSCTTGN